MTVGDLISYLKYYNNDVEVRLMIMPDDPYHPFECSIDRVVDSVYLNENGNEIEDVVYLTEGKRIGYGSKKAWK